MRNAPQEGDTVAMWALVGGAVAASSITPRLARRAPQRIPDPVVDAVVTGGMSAGSWAVVALAERLRPFDDGWNVADDDVADDLRYLLVSSPIGGLVATAGARTVMAALGPWAHGLASKWPRRAPIAVRVTLALGATELIHYWHHRLFHAVAPLWQLHAVHHSPRRLYWLNAVRFHPLDIVPLVMLQLLALEILGVDRETRLVTQTLKGIHGQLQHSNVRGRPGPLSWVFSTFEQHRWHHAVRSSVNYGAVLSVFDHLFGTFDGRRFDRGHRIGLATSESPEPSAERT